MKRVRYDAVDIQRLKRYKQAILISISGNIFLAVLKGIMAWLSGSSAVFSDAANSLGDTLYSIFMGIGLYLSQQPADESHPQGHSRIEPFVSLFISIAIAFAGVVAVQQGITRFSSGGRVADIGWTTLILVFSISIKVVMFWRVKRLGRETSSPAINASARDNLVDVATSAAALIGVWGAFFVDPIFDPIAGIVVGLWIFRTTWEILSENIGYLTGRGAPRELSQKIAKMALSVKGVDHVHRVIAEYVGPRMRIDMHINVNGKISLEKAHAIGERVSEKIRELSEVDLVFVHVEPTEPEIT